MRHRAVWPRPQRSLQPIAPTPRRITPTDKPPTLPGPAAGVAAQQVSLAKGDSTLHTPTSDDDDGGDSDDDEEEEEDDHDDDDDDVVIRLMIMMVVTTASGVSARGFTGC